MASPLARLGQLAPRSSALFVCDVQTKFAPIISGMPAVLDTASRMVRGANALNIPVLVTEQSPTKLGPTVDEVKSVLKPDVLVVSKTRFSMYTPEVKSWLGSRPAVKQVLLLGIEAHVCVLQTSLDLLQNGYEVHVIVDGVSSQRYQDRAVALQRMSQAGAFMATSEMVLFQLTEDASQPMFKAISALAKEKRDGDKLFPFFEKSSL